jgi:glycosyltransferase involved in cell wall biosynthesis
MLSICIPVYNFNITTLVNELYIQSVNLYVPIEIIIIDDASDEIFKQQNSILKSNKNLTYIELEKNLGRSKIRNHFLSYARYEYLLFMDCDSMITNRDYLQNYINACTGDAIICGGRKYETNRPDDDHYLRWLYGIKRESAPASVRSQKPNQSFMTNNFLISKSLLSSISFDETLYGYGHEDTVYGYQLKIHYIPIKHIENPLIHIGLEDKDEYIAKTVEGLSNLFRLYLRFKKNPAFVNDVKLLRFYRFLRRLQIIRILSWLFFIFKKSMLMNIRSSRPSLIIFDLYKLGYFCNISINARKNK